MDPLKGPFRKVYLPLEKLERCHACSKTAKPATLKLCSACGERSYCSPKCQKQDWPSHKVSCGKRTDLIELETYYPFLACMADAFHFNPDKPPHPAMTHVIVNSPNPGSHPTGLPDKSAANLVLLGDPLDQPTETGSEKWWPSAMIPNVRGKLLRRIVREGYALSVATSICLALFAEMYTTTFVSTVDSPPRRAREARPLDVQSSPIADFGVVAGSVDVKTKRNWCISASRICLSPEVRIPMTTIGYIYHNSGGGHTPRLRHVSVQHVSIGPRHAVSLQ
ncbi:hypothetical protein FB451DRAFT_1071222 [Mycena latifolia]|nr:hypothetical protein FB451DRAFT_1071222 [Mycena latifolia]